MMALVEKCQVANYLLTFYRSNDGTSADVEKCQPSDWPTYHCTASILTVPRVTRFRHGGRLTEQSRWQDCYTTLINGWTNERASGRSEIRTIMETSVPCHSVVPCICGLQVAQLVHHRQLCAVGREPQCPISHDHIRLSPCWQSTSAGHFPLPHHCGHGRVPGHDVPCCHFVEHLPGVREPARSWTWGCLDVEFFWQNDIVAVSLLFGN